MFDEQEDNARQNFLQTSTDQPAQTYRNESDQVTPNTHGYSPRIRVPAPVTRVASCAS